MILVENCVYQTLKKILQKYKFVYIQVVLFLKLVLNYLKYKYMQTYTRTLANKCVALNMPSY